KFPWAFRPLRFGDQPLLYPKVVVVERDVDSSPQHGLLPTASYGSGPIGPGERPGRAAIRSGACQHFAPTGCSFHTAGSTPRTTGAWWAGWTPSRCSSGKT